VNPDNLLILINHLKCAAFELPLREDEKFGALDLRRLCQHLEETGFLHHTQDGWHWVSESYPADALSLRSVSSDNFVIVDNTHEPRVIGETDFSSALTTLHEKAIYIQDGVQYHVERLDYDDRKAYVHRVDSEYFTDAISYTKIKILETFDSAHAGAARKNHGEVQVNTQVVGFKKIKFYTMENVGSGELTLPEQEMHTTAFWLTLLRPMMDALPYNSTERLDGVNGLANALGAIAALLVMCDARDLGTSVGENAELEVSTDVVPDVAPGFSPAPTLPTQPSETRGERPGKRTVVRKIFEPNIYLYDSYPGGVGLSEPLFRMSDSLLEKTHKLISECPCPTGCPSCVGPAGEIGEKGKEVALEMLRRMVGRD
jgi:DEAD/DEAH box helicase domain-containing protein